MIIIFSELFPCTAPDSKAGFCIVLKDCKQLVARYFSNGTVLTPDEYMDLLKRECTTNKLNPVSFEKLY